MSLPPPGSANRRRSTRTRATSLSFSWRGRLLWSAPPVLFLLWLASGPFGAFNPLALFIGAPMLYLTIWWLRQVWTPIALPVSPPDPIDFATASVADVPAPTGT